MKLLINYCLPLALVLGVVSCKKDNEKTPGNPVVELKSEFGTAYMGDSLEFMVNVGDTEVPLSTVKARLYYSGELVSETVIRTKAEGDYNGKVYIPYYPLIENGDATLKFVLQNIHFTTAEEEVRLPVERPDYAYLLLVAGETEHRLERTERYTYAVTSSFPARVNGYIKAPAFGDAGNELTFGWEDNAIKEGSTNNIPFSNFAGEYTIRFNSFSYEAEPFIVPTVNEEEMEQVDENTYRVDVTLNKGEEVIIEGFEDLDVWWIDPDYFSADDSGKLLFQPSSGSYRITASLNHKYFIVEALSGGEPAKLQPDGSGAVWIIGDGIGKPAVATNAVGWNTDKALCMAPMGGKKYQVTVVAGATVNATDINFKFFHQKGWGGEFKDTELTSENDLVFVGNGNNGRDPGNLGLVSGGTFEQGATYVFTVDLGAGNDKAVLTVEKQ